MKYSIELTKNQLNSLMFATDVISRLFAGQMHELNKISSHKIPKDMIGYLKYHMFPNLAKNESHGITSNEIDGNAKKLYDIHQAIRYFLAWENQKNTPQTRDWSKQMSVEFDEPLQASVDGPPIIKKINE